MDDTKKMYEVIRNYMDVIQKECEKLNIEYSVLDYKVVKNDRIITGGVVQLHK